MGLRIGKGQTREFCGRELVVQTSNARFSSDGGLVPIGQYDELIGLTKRIADAIDDPRDQTRVEHTVLEMVRSRVFGIIGDYQDQNDHDLLRTDPIFKLLAGRSIEHDALASQPTLSRFENSVTPGSLLRLQDVLADQFLDSFDSPPARLTLDVDAVDDPAHGEQQLTLFHAYYDQYQYLPLVITCAENEMIVGLALRPGHVHAALGADSDVERLVTRVRERFPNVEIHVRADCGFGVPAMYEVCERLRVWYTFGIGANAVLKGLTESLLERAKSDFASTKEPQRLFTSLGYRAKSWPKFRHVIAKAEAKAHAWKANVAVTNRRFVVTNRPGAAVSPEAIYDDYVMRGESENRNKEFKCGLGMDRLSDHRFMANLFRLNLHAAAHNLLVLLRAAVAKPAPASPVDGVPAEALAGAERRKHLQRRRDQDPLARAQPATWRTRLVKVAAEVTVSRRRVVISLSACWPYQGDYLRVCRRLAELASLPRRY